VRDGRVVRVVPGATSDWYDDAGGATAFSSRHIRTGLRFWSSGRMMASEEVDQARGEKWTEHLTIVRLSRRGKPARICVLSVIAVVFVFAVSPFTALSLSSSGLSRGASSFTQAVAGNFADNVTGPVSIVGNATPCTTHCPPFQGPLPFHSVPAIGPASRPAFVTDVGAAKPSIYLGHYWLGSYYYPPGQLWAQSIYTTLSTPSSGPNANDNYYLLLSTWDTNGNYDQIGLTSWYTPQHGGGTLQQVWELLWSITNYNSCNAPAFNPIAGTLPQFATLTFQMVLTGSQIQYNVYAGTGVGGTLILTVSHADTASHFIIGSSSSYCGGTYNTTVYEEVHTITTTMQFPEWVFQFSNTYAGSTLITSWGSVNVADSGATLPSNAWGYYEVYLNSGKSIQIANEPFQIQFPNDAPVIAPGGHYTANGNVVDVGSYCSWGYSPCTLTESCSVPSGWASSYSWGTYVPTSVSFTMGPPTSAPPGFYYPGCFETISAGPNAFSDFIFYVYVT
jgi:hypothetical protein